MLGQVRGIGTDLLQLATQEGHKRRRVCTAEKLCPTAIEKAELLFVAVDDEPLNTVQVTVAREPAAWFKGEDRFEAG